MTLDTWSLKQAIGSNTDVLAFCKRTDGALLLGSSPDGQISISTDHGRTWNLYSSLPAVTRINTMIYAGYANMVLAGGGPSGVIFRSYDNGLSYTKTLDLGGSRDIHCIASPQDIIFLAGAGGGAEIYRSMSNGATWSLVATLGTETAVWCIIKSSPGHCLAGTGNSGRVYRSINSGGTWPSYATVGSQKAIYSLCAVSGGPVLCGTYPGCQIWFSTDDGVSWNPAASLAPGSRVRRIVDLGGGTILAGTDNSARLWVSYNYGYNWEPLTTLGTQHEVTGLLFDSPNYAIAGTTPAAQVWGSALFLSPPVANFSATPTTGTAPLGVSFADESVNDPDTWFWEFGDGETSELQNPYHVYSAGGSFTVKLTASNYAGSNTITKTGYITVTPGYQHFPPMWNMVIGPLE